MPRRPATGYVVVDDGETKALERTPPAKPVRGGRGEGDAPAGSATSPDDNLLEHFAPSGATRDDVARTLAEHDGHAGWAAKALRSRYPAKQTEANPLHLFSLSPGTPADEGWPVPADEDPVPEPEPEPEPELKWELEPEPEPEFMPRGDDQDDERSGLMVATRSDSPRASLSFDSNVQASIVYDLEAILPSPAVALKPAARPGKCQRAAGRCKPAHVQLATFSLGYVLLQSALWSGAWDSALRYSIPGWLAFLAWAVVYRKEAQDESMSIAAVARATRVDAEELRAKAQAMGVDVDAEAFLLPVVADAIRAPLPEGWKEGEGVMGKYYYNTVTRERASTNPQGRAFANLIAAERRAYRERNAGDASTTASAVQLELELQLQLELEPEPEPEPEPELEFEPVLVYRFTTDAFLIRGTTGLELLDGTEGLDVPEGTQMVGRYWAGDTVDVLAIKHNGGRRMVNTLSRGWLNIATSDGKPLLEKSQGMERFESQRQSRWTTVAVGSRAAAEMTQAEVQAVLEEWYRRKRHRYTIDKSDVCQIIETFRSQARSLGAVTSTSTWQEKLWDAYSVQGLFPVMEVAEESHDGRTAAPRGPLMLPPAPAPAPAPTSPAPILRNRTSLPPPGMVPWSNPRSAVGTKKLPKYVIKKDQRIQSGFETTSIETGSTSLKIGQVITAIETKVNDKGITRIKFTDGWISVKAEDGTVLLASTERGDNVTAEETVIVLDGHQHKKLGLVLDGSSTPCAIKRITPDGLAANTPLVVGSRLVRVNRVNLRSATYAEAMAALRQASLYRPVKIVTIPGAALSKPVPEWGLEHALAQDMPDPNSLPFQVSSPTALSKMREEAVYLPGEKQTETEKLDEYNIDRVQVVAASLREELHADTGSDAGPVGSDALFEVIKPHVLLWHYYKKHNSALANRKVIQKILVGTGCISKQGPWGLQVLSWNKTPRGVDYLFDKLERKYGEHPQQLFEALYDTKSGAWASIVEGTVERDESLPSQEGLIAARRRRGRSWTSVGQGVSSGHRRQVGWHFVTAQGYSEDEIRRGVVSVPFLTEQLAPEDEGLHRVCLHSPDGTVERWVEGSDRPAPIEFTNIDGDISILKLATVAAGRGRSTVQLQWWSGGICHASDVKELKWEKRSSVTGRDLTGGNGLQGDLISCPHVSVLNAALHRETSEPRAGPAREQMKADLMALATAAGVRLVGDWAAPAQANALDTRPPSRELLSQTLSAGSDGTTGATPRHTTRIPPYWTPISTAPDDGGWDPDTVLKHELLPESSEYAKVAERFHVTCPTEQYSVTSVCRVQNFAEWNLFQEKARVMKNRDETGANMQELFHGTSEDIAQQIITHNFSRTFSTVAAYGRGVYFAQDARYSAHPNYSKPNDNGEQFMILAKVLVGHTIRGRGNMQEPPPRKLDDGTDGPLYDSLSDQSGTIIVSCHRDYQAYAEYIICFVQHASGTAPPAATVGTLLHGNTSMQASKEYKVLEQAVAVHSGPLLSAEIVGWLLPGHYVTALDENRDADGHDWLKINVAPEQWVSAATSSGSVVLSQQSTRASPQIEFVSLDPPRFKYIPSFTVVSLADRMRAARDRAYCRWTVEHYRTWGVGAFLALVGLALEIAGCASAASRVGFGSAVDVQVGLVDTTCTFAIPFAMCSAVWMGFVLCSLIQRVLPSYSRPTSLQCTACVPGPRCQAFRLKAGKCLLNTYCALVVLAWIAYFDEADGIILFVVAVPIYLKCIWECCKRLPLRCRTCCTSHCKRLWTCCKSPCYGAERCFMPVPGHIKVASIGTVLAVVAVAVLVLLNLQPQQDRGYCTASQISVLLSESQVDACTRICCGEKSMCVDTDPAPDVVQGVCTCELGASPVERVATASIEANATRLAFRIRDGGSAGPLDVKVDDRAWTAVCDLQTQVVDEGARCGRPAGTYIDYQGMRFATLTAGISPHDTDEGHLGDDTSLPLPGPGWEIAEHTSRVVSNVVSQYPWGTHCLIFANGQSYYTSNTGSAGSAGGGCGGDELRPHGGGLQTTYGLRPGCCRRVLIQCSLSGAADLSRQNHVNLPTTLCSALGFSAGAARSSLLGQARGSGWRSATVVHVDMGANTEGLHGLGLTGCSGAGVVQDDISECGFFSSGALSIASCAAGPLYLGCGDQISQHEGQMQEFTAPAWDGSLAACTDTGTTCYGSDDGDTDYCQTHAQSNSVCYQHRCYYPASCIPPPSYWGSGWADLCDRSPESCEVSPERCSRATCVAGVQVVLADDYRSHGDALRGPLSPGEVGTISSLSSSSGRPGVSGWYYDFAALHPMAPLFSMSSLQLETSSHPVCAADRNATCSTALVHWAVTLGNAQERRLCDSLCCLGHGSCSVSGSGAASCECDLGYAADNHLSLDRNAAGAWFRSNSAACLVSDGDRCVATAGFSHGLEYDDDVSCEITVTGIGPDIAATLSVEDFSTERCCDHLTIDGREFDGSEHPSGALVLPSSTITWRTDGSTTDTGWKICLHDVREFKQEVDGCVHTTDACSSGQIGRAAAAGATTAERARCDSLCCGGHGTCSADGGGRCVCEFGYFGDHCEERGCTSEQIAVGFESDLCHTMCCSAPNGACSADGSCSCALGFGPESHEIVRCTASTCVAGDEVVLTDDYRSYPGGPLSPGEVGTISSVSMFGLLAQVSGYTYDFAALAVPVQPSVGCSEPTATCTLRQVVVVNGGRAFNGDRPEQAACNTTCCNGRGLCSPLFFDADDDEWHSPTLDGGRWSCDCDLGYLGEHCESKGVCTSTQISGHAGTADCDVTCCSGNGRCSPTGSCTCELGYGPSGSLSSSPQCSQNASSCDSNQILASSNGDADQRALCDSLCCGGHGTCSADGGGRCVCEFGYFGDHCEERGCTSEQIAVVFESDLCHTMCCSAPNGACSADGSCSCALGFGPESSLSRCTASTCVAGDEVVLTDDYRSYSDASGGPLSPGEVGTISYTSGSSVYVSRWYYNFAALRPHAKVGCSEPTTTCTPRQIGSGSSTDECSAACCSGFGVCGETGWCRCELGHIGEQCQEVGCEPAGIAAAAETSECRELCCADNGQCSGTGVCSCDIGFGGETCQASGCTAQQIRLAASIQGDALRQCDEACCSSRGRCTMEGDCTCDLGYQGTRCDSRGCTAEHILPMASQGVNLEQCAEMCCAGRGLCSTQSGGSCECNVGFGPEDSTGLLAPASSSSSDRLLCDVANYTCSSGQIGRAAAAGATTAERARCDSLCCGGHGTCSADGGGRCVCEFGYFGDHCEERGCTSEQIAVGFESDLCHTMCCSAPNGACSADGSCSCALGFGPKLMEPVPLTGCPDAGSLVRIIPGTRYDHGSESSNPGGVDGHITDCDSSDSLHVSWTNGQSNSYTFRDLYLVSRQGVFGCSEPTTTCTSRQIVVGSSTDECSAACCSGFGACREDGVCQCDSDHHGEECEFDDASAGDPDQCPGLNLALTTSPYAGSTSSASDSFSLCGRGRDQVFFIDLPPGQRLEIGQTTNSYDSKHTTRWGGACPGDYSISCTDDPDNRRHYWTNHESQTERVYFIVDAYGSGSGSFTLTWSVSDGSCADICNRLSCGSDCPICAGTGAGYPGNGCSGCESGVQC